MEAWGGCGPRHFVVILARRIGPHLPVPFSDESFSNAPATGVPLQPQTGRLVDGICTCRVFVTLANSIKKSCKAMTRGRCVGQRDGEMISDADKSLDAFGVRTDSARVSLQLAVATSVSEKG